MGSGWGEGRVLFVWLSLTIGCAVDVLCDLCYRTHSFDVMTIASFSVAGWLGALLNSS